MRQLSAIANRIGERLDAIRFQSLYNRGVLEETYTCVYLRFDDSAERWIRIASDGGETRVEVTAEPALRAFDASGDGSQSPISELPPGHALCGAIGQRLDAVRELVEAGGARRSYGVELELEGARVRVRSIDGTSLDLSAGRSRLPPELRLRPVLRLVPSGDAGG